MLMPRVKHADAIRTANGEWQLRQCSCVPSDSDELSEIRRAAKLADSVQRHANARSEPP